jgi:hypothetical protein
MWGEAGRAFLVMISSLSPVPMLRGFPSSRRRNAKSAPRCGSFFLSAALIADSAAQGQTTSPASDGKRIQVLQIVEAGSAKANYVKKSRSSSAAKKKVAIRIN